MPRILGTVLNDILRGNPGRDQIFGLAGDDEIRGGGGKDFLDGGPGRDLVIGGNGDDRIVGGTYVPETRGEDNDTIDGENGSDWVSYYTLDDFTYINLGAGFAISESQTDQLISIENAIGSPVGITTLRGSPADNVLVATSDTTDFWSSAGDDTYLNSGGFNTLISIPIQRESL